MSVKLVIHLQWKLVIRHGYFLLYAKLGTCHESRTTVDADATSATPSGNKSISELTILSR
jgi:hypothetical protein